MTASPPETMGDGEGGASPLRGHATQQSPSPAVSALRVGIVDASKHWSSAEAAELAREYATKDRADLCHGEMSDFALANAVFMADRFDLDLIVWQTAAKERIRWLSVQHAKATGAA